MKIIIGSCPLVKSFEEEGLKFHYHSLAIIHKKKYSKKKMPDQKEDKRSHKSGKLEI